MWCHTELSQGVNLPPGVQALQRMMCDVIKRIKEKCFAYCHLSKSENIIKKIKEINFNIMCFPMLYHL